MYRIVQLRDMQTCSELTILTACASADSAACSQQPAGAVMAPLISLMQQLSTTCPVIAAGEITLQQNTDTDINSVHQQTQICLLPPVQTSALTASHGFFAAVCHVPDQQIQLSNVQTILPQHATAASQYMHSAHTVSCTLQHSPSMTSLVNINSTVKQSSAQQIPGANAQHTTGDPDTASAKLRSFFAAAEQVWQLVMSIIKSMMTDLFCVTAVAHLRPVYRPETLAAMHMHAMESMRLASQSCWALLAVQYRER